MTAKELYPSLVQMIIHAESVTWNRFYNFLMFNTILVLSWSTIWVSNCSPQGKTVVLATICIVGGVSGVFWSALGYRGRKFLSEYMGMAEKLEADPATWEKEIHGCKLATRTTVLRDSLCYPWSGSKMILIYGPLAFTVIYVVMLVVSFL